MQTIVIKQDECCASAEKGYASEDVNKHFGLCKICYSYSLTRKELNQLGLKRL